MKLNYRVSFINDRPRLEALGEALASATAVGLDIETVEWWSPQTERVALVQVAHRTGGELRVAVVDALALPELAPLRRPLELSAVTKAVHNAAFDAPRLSRHFRINAAPIHDTLIAARRNGERRYSLQAQAETHLRLALDKGARLSDWGVRPLHPEQVNYAALDAAVTLLLYEHQAGRGLSGDYRPRARAANEQGTLPLNSPLATAGRVTEVTPETAHPHPGELSGDSLALLGIVIELPSRYSPEHLAVSVGADRVGLAGWIVDRVLGRDADLDEDTAKLRIAELCRRGLVRITPARKLEASEAGRGVWREHRP